MVQNTIITILTVEATDEYELFYRYDADGNLVVITRVNLSDNTSEDFAVVTNILGDVIELLDASSNVVATYTYDAWGNLISVKNGSGTDVTSSAHIGLQNSVRYRGYVYDSETNLTIHHKHMIRFQRVYTKKLMFLSVK